MEGSIYEKKDHIILTPRTQRYLRSLIIKTTNLGYQIPFSSKTSDVIEVVKRLSWNK